MLQDILNSELEKMSNWLMANKLTVNIKKTIYAIFKVRQKQLPSVLFNIKNNNETFERKTHTKFLGVYEDENFKLERSCFYLTCLPTRSLNLLVL